MLLYIPFLCITLNFNKMKKLKFIALAMLVILMFTNCDKENYKNGRQMIRYTISCQSCIFSYQNEAVQNESIHQNIYGTNLIIFEQLTLDTVYLQIKGNPNYFDYQDVLVKVTKNNQTLLNYIVKFHPYEDRRFFKVSLKSWNNQTKTAMYERSYFDRF